MNRFQTPVQDIAKDVKTVDYNPCQDCALASVSYLGDGEIEYKCSALLLKARRNTQIEEHGSDESFEDCAIRIHGVNGHADHPSEQGLVDMFRSLFRDFTRDTHGFRYSITQDNRRDAVRVMLDSIEFLYATCDDPNFEIENFKKGVQEEFDHEQLKVRLNDNQQMWHIENHNPALSDALMSAILRQGSGK